jgi:hypothetical protein
VRRDASNSHIQIIPRPPDPDPEPCDLDEEQCKPRIPVRTNHSYLIEAEATISDIGTAGTHQRQTFHQTFADMARVGVGGQDAAYKNELMASHEPQSLGNYLKFTKPKVTRGVEKVKVDLTEGNCEFPSGQLTNFSSV